MADLELARDFILQFEGINNIEEKYDPKILLCSDCFQDEGLRALAFRNGIENEQQCPNCKSSSGRKLNKKIIHDLCYSFFVRGTIHKGKYGGAPTIQYNPQHFNQTEIEFSPWLTNDLRLLEQAGEVGFFYYGPRGWMLGDIEPLLSLQNEEECNSIVEKILEQYPIRELTERHYSYRVRLNPKVPHDFTEYDSAPEMFLGKNRFDYEGFPVLYASPDLELCIHECRSAVNDNIYVAKLAPTRKLKVLDLSVVLSDEGTEFESLDLAIHFLFLAESHSYKICRRISSKAKEKGLDGIIYPSYFSNLRTGLLPFETIYGMSVRKIANLKDYVQSQSVPNLALFGRPIKEDKLSVECINKVVINRVNYDLTFGPAFHKSTSPKDR